MEKNETYLCSGEDHEHLLPVVGTVVNVCGGNESISETFKGMLCEKLLWANGEFCPIGIPQRLLPSPLLSDEKGLEMWRTINKLPAYYQTDAEIRLLEERGHEIAMFVPPCAILVDLGCGDVRKIKPLLDCLERLENPVWYFAIDLARGELERGMTFLASSHYKHVKHFGLWGTFDDGLAWLNAQSFDRPRFFASLGSIFGNDHFNDAVTRLSDWRTQGFRGSTDRLLLTMDATSDGKALWESYHDSHGHFEKFIRNGYKHSNRILGHDWYHDDDWEFHGIMQEEPLMHRFVIRATKNVICLPLKLELSTGTEIDCYEAFKYPPDLMRREFAESGFDEIACWKARGAQTYQYLLVSENSDSSV